MQGSDSPTLDTVPTSSPVGLLEIGPATHLDDPPPPISGGTLAVSKPLGAAASTVVAADPDRDAVYIVDLATATPRTVQLGLHDEPGRVAISPDGRTAFVALRRGGAVVAIDLDAASITSRTSTCPAPRGIAWDPNVNALRVVCMGGEIVTVERGVVTKTTRIPSLTDLRDVMITRSGHLLVTTFRNAEVFELDSAGSAVVAPAIEWLPQLPQYSRVRRVAWKTMIAAAPPEDTDARAERVTMVSQSDGDAPVETPPQYYNVDQGGRGGARVVVTVNDRDVVFSEAVVPVDVAAKTNEVAVASVGNTHFSGGGQILLASGSSYGSGYYDVTKSFRVPGEITALSYLDNGLLVAQSREPARLLLINTTQRSIERQIELSSLSRADTGHTIFHANSGAGMACASCHPEGRDDGHSWKSLELGARRTPSLIGTVKSTAPYHWNGEAADMKALAKLTFVDRMKGPSLRDDQMTTLDQWLTELPAPPASLPLDAAAVTRGAALFTGEKAKCATCHLGASFTSNLNMNVKTNGFFQVPSLLGVAHRAPYFHDGSAPTLLDVLSSGHNGTSLSSQESIDLLAYLGTL